MKKGVFTSNLSLTLPKLTGQRTSKNTARATQNLYAGQMWPAGHGLNAPGLTHPKLMWQTKNARNSRTSGGSLNSTSGSQRDPRVSGSPSLV